MPVTCIVNKKLTIEKIEEYIKDEQQATFDYSTFGNVALFNRIQGNPQASEMARDILEQLSTDEGKHHKALQELRSLISTMPECKG